MTFKLGPRQRKYTRKETQTPRTLPLHRLQPEQHQEPRIVPVGAINIGVLRRRPVLPVGLVVRDAVIPLHNGDGGQFGQPDFHSLAKERLQRRVVGRGLPHLIDQRVKRRIRPAPEPLRVRAGGLDEAAVVEPQGEVRIAHARAVAHQEGPRRALRHPRKRIGRHAEVGVETRPLQLRPPRPAPSP